MNQLRCRYIGGFPLNRDANKNQPDIVSASWASNPRTFAPRATFVFAFTGRGGTYLYARIMKPREKVEVRRNLNLNWQQLHHMPEIRGTFCLFNPNIPVKSAHIVCHLVIVEDSGRVMMLTRVRVGLQPPPTCIYEAVLDIQNHEPHRPVAVRNVAFTSDGLVLLIFTSFTKAVRSMRWCQQNGSVIYSWKSTDVIFEHGSPEFHSLIGCTPKDNETVFAAASSSRIRMFQRTDNGVDIDWNPVGYNGFCDVNGTTAMCFNPEGTVLATLNQAGVVTLFYTVNANVAPCIFPMQTVAPPADAPPISKIAWTNGFSLLYCMGSLRGCMCLEIGHYDLPLLRRPVVLGGKMGAPPHDMVLQILSAPSLKDAMMIAVLGHNMMMHFYSGDSRFLSTERNLLQEKFLTRGPASTTNKLVRYKAKREVWDGNLKALLLEAVDQVGVEEARLDSICRELDKAVESYHAEEIDAAGLVQRCEQIRENFGSGSGGPPDNLVPIYNSWEG